MEPNELLLRGRRRPFEALVEFAIRSSGWIVIATIVLIFVFVGKEAVPLLTSSEVHEEVTLGSMVLPRPGEELEEKFPWQPIGGTPKYSLIPLLIGTLKVTLVALLIALPVAIGAAIFTSEFSNQIVRELIKPAVEILAGIPSVVIGFFPSWCSPAGCRTPSASSSASTRSRPGSAWRWPSFPSSTR